MKYLLENQPNIKDVSVHSTMMNQVDWKQLKLTSLTINGWTAIGEVIKGQNELKHLSVNKTIYHDDFLFICSELKLLESLDIWTENILPSNYEKMSNLQKLKKARIFMSLSETPSIQFIRSYSLTDLEINCFNATPNSDAVVKLGLRCPNLKNFKLSANVTFNFLNMIVENFCKLESLSLIFDSRSAYEYKDGLQHENLKSMFIQSAYSDCQQLPKLLKNCRKLEEFSTSLTLNASFIQDLLMIQPNLKSLSLTMPYTDYTSRKVNKEFILTLSNFGRNLNSFHFIQFRFEGGVSSQTLREAFKDQFKDIKMKGEDIAGCREWMMKRL